ncbi:MAG: ABC transporter permease subunit [Gammaproteobacteria bacterium]|jgi:ABC-2 type transport system permease protein|nr:ABC transporter permease subunit [Gammaproteobacteria bacterium]MBT4493866.1 ABC transporter permease subunit [Gammaproteobacteria bacterium]
MNIRSIGLIYRRELGSYFSSHIAYVVIAVFLLVTGYFFYNLLASFSVISFQAQTNAMLARQANLLNINETVVRPLFGNISIVMLLMTPFLTMRLIAEERKSRTLELLRSYPVSDIDVILAKYFACMTVLLAMILPTLIYPIFLVTLGDPEVMPIATGYLGLILLGGTFIAVGLFASSITENQIVAASVSFGLLFCFWLLSYSVAFVSAGFGRFLTYIAINEHLESLAKGVLDSEDIIYYLGLIALFLFLSLRSMESKQW